MRIEKLVIYGYGKWQEKTLTLNEYATIILGENEAGKSTIQSFIKSILFGFPSKRHKAKENRYVPKQNPKQYGGKLVVWDDTYKRLSIERVSTIKKPLGELTIKNEYGETLPEGTLDQLLNGLDQEAYDKFFALQLKQLHELTQIDKNQLNRYFLTLGQTGSNQLFEVSDKARLTADKLYRPKGQLALNKALEELTQLKTKLDEAKQQQADYQTIKMTYAQLQQEVDNLQVEEKHTQAQLNHIAEDERLYTMYRDYTQLAQTSETQTQVTQEMFTAFELLQSKKESLCEQINQLQTRQATQQTALSEEMQFLHSHQDYVKSLVQSLPQVEQLLKSAAEIEYKQSQQEDSLKQEYARLGFYKQETLPSESLKTNDQLATLLAQQQVVAEHIQQHKQDLAHMQEQLLTKQNERIALQKPTGDTWVLEELLKKERVWSVGALVAAVIGVLGIVFTPIMAGIGLVLVGVTGYRWFVIHQHKQVEQDRLQKGYTRELADYQTKLSQLETDLTQLTQKRQDTLSQLKNLEQQEAHLMTQEQDFKENYQIPDNLTLSQLQDETLDYARQLQHHVHSSQEQLAQLDVQVQEQNQRFDSYAQAFHLTSQSETIHPLAQLRLVVRHFKEKVQEVKMLHAKQEEQQKYMAQTQQDLQRYTQELEMLQTKEVALLNQANVQTVAQFYHLAQMQQSRVQTKEKLTALAQHLQPHLTRLKTYRDAQEISEKKAQIVQQFTKVQHELNDKRQQLAHVWQMQQHIEQDGTYDQLKQSYASQKETVKDMLVTVGSYYTLAKIMDEVLQANQTNRLDDVVNMASTILQYVTQQDMVLTFVDEILVVHKQETVFELQELSQGTLEQVYIAIRLAFMKQLHHKVQLPIIIDDCFVNFDWARRRRMYAYLTEQFDNQFIYTTVDKHSLETFDPKRTSVVTLERTI